MYGTLLKLPTGFSGKILSQGSVFRAVVIAGELQYTMPKEKVVKTLEAGSYFGSTGEAVHPIAPTATEEVIIYIRTNGKYEITPSME